jgi:uncharacterized RDD family membrane protein YckC
MFKRIVPPGEEIRLRDILLMPLYVVLATLLITWPALLGILVGYPIANWLPVPAPDLAEIVFWAVTIAGYGWLYFRLTS